MARPGRMVVKAAWSPGAVPFVGRDTELGLLVAVMAEAKRGHPRTVLVDGEAGVGKTRLLHEALGAASADGWQVLAGSCHDDLPLPYQPLRDALSAMAGPAAAGALSLLETGGTAAPRDGPADTPTDRISVSLFAPVAALLVGAARERPLLLAVEDVHWAEPTTLELLAHVVAEADRRALSEAIPLVIVLTSRPPTGSRPDALRRLLREQGSTHLHLQGLDELEVNALLTAVGPAPPDRRLLGSFHDATDGNPLLLLSLLHRLADEGQLAIHAGELVSLAGDEPFRLPADLDRELEAQIDRVSPACRDLLTTAAVLGDGRPLELLAVVVGPDATFDDLLDEAEDAALLIGDGSSYRFGHPQLRQLLAGSLSGRRRQRLHRRIADRLEEGLGKDADHEALAIANHLRRAGNDVAAERLHRWNRLAGDQAFAVAAWAEAAACYDAAIDTLEPGLRGDAIQLRMRAARAHFRDHDLAMCRTALGVVIREAEAMGELEVQTDASLLLVQANLTLDAHMPGHRPDTSPLTTLLVTLGDREPLLSARAHALLSECLFSSFDVANGLEHARLALNLAGACDDDWIGSEVEFAIGLQQLAALDLDQAGASFERSIEHATALDDPWPTAWGLGRLPAVRSLEGRPDDAAELAERVVDLAGAHGDWAEQSLAAAYLVGTRFVQGRFVEAEHHARLSALAYQRSAYAFTPTVLYPALAGLRATRGDHRGALEALDAWQATAGRGTYPYRVAVEAMTGDADQLALLLADRPWRTVHGDGTLFSLGLLGLQVEVADASGKAELSACSVPRLQDAFERGVVVTPGWPLLIPRLLGLAALLGGDAQGAATWLQQAAGHARRAGAPLELASVRLSQARCELANGPEGRPLAARLLDEALVAAEHLGALALARRIRALADRERLALPSASAGQGTRLLLCTDLVGSTELNARLGDEGYLEVLREHNRLARQALRDHGGVEFKHVGDGVFAWFSSAVDAVGAGLAMVASTERFSLVHPGEALHLRVGLAAGEPLADEGDLFGLSVARAARITATCSGGDVRVEAEVVAMASDGAFSFQPLGSFELRGLPAPVELFEVTTGSPL